MNTVHELVRKAESDYTNGTTNIGKYVEFNQCENLEKIDAYLNSRHTSGETDSMGREKPFFNIVTAAVNIWFRATDIDRKNIRIKATKAGHYVLAFLATILLQEWMRKQSFGAFLNDWGRSLARYGSTVLKFIDQGGELHADVIPWNRIICDQIDFENNAKIEKLWLTPAQLLKRDGYDKDMVDKLLMEVTSRQSLSGQKKDNKNEFIPIYEVHGELPLSFLTGKDKDEDEYVQQMHVVTFLAKRDKPKGEYEDYTLISGRESKDPYMITHLIREDGRTQSIGAVEHLFEAQWMMNHTAKQIKDQLDLSSKLIFQTSDGNFVGQNALTSIETGDVLIHALNQPLTQIANRADITALQAYGAQWKALGNEITGVSESMLGNAAPSGTAWRQVEALLNESHSLFEIMTENKGLAVEEMLTKYIIPNLKKKMDTSDEISAILEDHQVTQLDSMYVPAEVTRRTNDKVKKTILGGGIVDPLDMEMFKAQQGQDIQGELNKNGNQRFIKPSDVKDKTWKAVMKDLEWEVEVDITGESVDKQNIVTTLTTVLQTIATNPMVLQDPNARLIFNRILETTGAISPIEMSQVKQQPQMQQMQPAPVGVGGSAGMPQMQPQTK